jgi:flagellar hook assembly protein FlgD
VLDAGWREAGVRDVAWDGTDDRGVAVSSGMYYVRVRTATGNVARKVTLVR